MVTLFSDTLLCVINTGIMNKSVFLVKDYNGHQIHLSSMPSNISSLYTLYIIPNGIKSTHKHIKLCQCIHCHLLSKCKPLHRMLNTCDIQYVTECYILLSYIYIYILASVPALLCRCMTYAYLNCYVSYVFYRYSYMPTYSLLCLPVVYYVYL